MRNILIVLTLMFALVACSQNALEDEGSAPAPQQSSEISPSNPHGGQVDVDAPKPERKIVVPPEVQAKYKSLIFQATDKESGSQSQTEVLIGQKADVPGTPLAIEVSAYLPHFMMDNDNSMTSLTTDETNPAAKVQVYRDGELVFDGWMFKNFPDIHGAFADPKYTVEMLNSVQK